MEYFVWLQFFILLDKVEYLTGGTALGILFRLRGLANADNQGKKEIIW